MRWNQKRTIILGLQRCDKAAMLDDKTIIYFTEFAWKKSSVPREEIQFCSCNPSWPPWCQLQTSNNISFIWINVKEHLFIRQVCNKKILENFFYISKHNSLFVLKVSGVSFFHTFQSHLFPTVHLFWKDYRTRLLAKLKDLGTGLVLAGDGRHDSMGHCAKFGAYTILCCTAIPSIIHFALVQVCTTWMAIIILSFWGKQKLFGRFTYLDPQ